MENELNKDKNLYNDPYLNNAQNEFGIYMSTRNKENLLKADESLAKVIGKYKGDPKVEDLCDVIASALKQIRKESKALSAKTKAKC